VARDEGFYWVRWQHEPDTDQVAEWSSRGRFETGWYLTGWDYPEPDERIRVISDRLNPPSHSVMKGKERMA
jgi:hypothetical protein